MSNAKDHREEWVQRILKALDGLEYGSVQIVVHDSQITQIERLEKLRFQLEKADKPATARKNG
ncbi:YezD family protein [Brevibacillus ruminantium]|uniref:YezD family protein n=1 Tax=Brevibacillus ruminantium TaxID=2950604 RepID=A0ABY4WIU9_9BACL|nr:YezD family protein [Brevibacillus ruminantium]USG66629.1 YezD family protein [Brevibacillus ruminantium]